MLPEVKPIRDMFSQPLESFYALKALSLKLVCGESHLVNYMSLSLQEVFFNVKIYAIKMFSWGKQVLTEFNLTREVTCYILRS